MPLHYQPALSPLRVAQPPKGYERPAGLPRYTVKAVAPLLPRLRCGACRARLQVEWPLDCAGRLYCVDCGREYAEIVDKLPAPLSAFRSDETERRRGRPPKSRTAREGEDARSRGGRPPKSVKEPAGEAVLCIDCNLRRPKYQRVRCQPCVFARTHPSRLCPDCQTHAVSRSRWVRCSSCEFARRWDTSLAKRLLELLADGRWRHRDELHDTLGISNQQLRSSVQQARDRGWSIKLVKSGYRLEGVAT
jgi:biotin operon repressor